MTRKNRHLIRKKTLTCGLEVSSKFTWEATDENGDLYVYVKKPIKGTDKWFDHHDCEYVANVPHNNWEESLEVI